jgi:hypothetical protein
MADATHPSAERSDVHISVVFAPRCRRVGATKRLGNITGSSSGFFSFRINSRPKGRRPAYCLSWVSNNTDPASLTATVAGALVAPALY